MNCEKFTKLIDEYLKGKIPGDNIEEFEEHYFTCDKCYLALRLHERLLSKEVKIPPGKKSTVKVLRPAAIFASLVVIAFSILLVVNNINNKKFRYKISSFELPFYIESETRMPVFSNKFSEAMFYYNNGNFKRALKILRNIDIEEKNISIVFFRGICYLINDELTLALKDFDLIIKEMNPSYYDEAIYYKGISLLRLNEIENALEQFNHLKDMFSPYSSKATYMIEKIKEAGL